LFEEGTMGDRAEHSAVTAAGWKRHWRRSARSLLVFLTGCLALSVAFFAGPLAPALVGALLILSGVLEGWGTFQAIGESGRRSAYLGGTLSVLAGLLVMAAPGLVLGGLAIVLAGLFFIDGIGKARAAWRGRAAGRRWLGRFATGTANVLIALVLVVQWPVSGPKLVLILVGLHMLTAGWSILTEEIGASTTSEQINQLGRHPDGQLNLALHQEFAALEATLQSEDDARRRVDLYWCLTLIIVFFAIHLGRMNGAWNLVGMISPLAAALGDVGTAFVVAFGLGQLAWRKLTRPAERRGWQRILAGLNQGDAPGWFSWLNRAWLVRRLRFSRRLAQMRHSPGAALRWGLQVGLPLVAILIAVNPIWGFNWFFNSESWATGIWDHWAAARTDTWREQMIRAVGDHYRPSQIPADHLFQVAPTGVAGDADFSFLVLGDTGEGGAAQQSLRDQYLFLGQRPDVKFLVISSDVIYPSGAMADYESKFYLPFKGFTKPIYAIPGNHDWYDALEGFAANFLEADAARVCMHARVVADNRLTTTTDERIDAMIRQAARLRQEYGVVAGWQRGPFFEVQTDRFALIAVDTGVLRRMDTQQWAWLKAVLDHSRGKFILVILGHPLYAGGRSQGTGDAPRAGEWTASDTSLEIAGQRLGAQTAPFVAIHQLLRDHQVPVVMAGDTHYFEYYQEPYEAAGAARLMHHFVNGGGGAYLSIGTPLDWPHQAALADSAYFPRKDFLIAKLDRETPVWKAPLWWWAKHFHAWPFTAEAMAGAFLYNQAPFLQSFVEVRVENSKNQVRLIAHGATGPLHWRDLETFGGVMPSGRTGADMVEVLVPMPGQRP
jgi:uncharacterized membrane protein HdeD (DUF308 family)